MSKVCKWLSDDDQEICCNGDCPAVADFCPCVNWPEVCKYREGARTNADRYRAMTTEEMVKFFSSTTECDVCDVLKAGLCNINRRCIDSWREWLNKSVEEVR